MIIHYRPVNRSAITVDIIQTIVTKKAWNSLNIETHWALPISFRVEILAGFQWFRCMHAAIPRPRFVINHEVEFRLGGKERGRKKGNARFAKREMNYRLEYPSRT